MNVSFTTTTFAPVVLGFFGLGTGYLIYGPQELFGFPARNASVDRATGVWGIWLPGFCQFVTGIYLFAALTLFESLKAPALYMAAVAFTAYGIHWFAIGWGRYQGNDPAPSGFMAIAFTILSVLGMVVFFSVGGWPVGVLFLGLTLIYIAEFFANLKIGVRENAGGEGMAGAMMSNPGERALGLFHLLTGVWLMYLTFATMLDITLHATLPGG